MTIRSPYLEGGGPKGLIIDGRSVPAQSGKTFATINPATGETLAQIAEGAEADIDVAVAAARRAFEEGPWSRFKPFDRQQVILALADLIDRHFEELALLDTLDMGAPLSRTMAGRRRAVALLRYYAGLATSLRGDTIPNSAAGDVFSYTLKEPVGVVGAINPWNAPMGLAIWKLGPVLATGCTLVFKPAEQAPLTALRLAELALEAGLPPGVFNVVTGFAAAGAALSAHPGVDKIAFTGSTEVGQKIVRAAAGNLKRMSMELGGKSPNIVFADADLDKAVPGAAMAVFQNSGQICSAGTRLYVERPIYDEFVGKVAEFASELRVGDPLDPSTELGPVVSAEQLERVTSYLELGKVQGARALAGGARLSGAGLDRGYFVAPTVFADVKDEMRIAREEIFGPVLSALPFDSIDEVVKRANDTPYGLGAGVWSRNVSTVHTVAKSLRTGSVWANCYQVMDPAIPFGGYKSSGFGRESGVEHLHEYLQTKAVALKLD
jgi:aldehyde dehydrogenase (NAD+)